MHSSYNLFLVTCCLIIHYHALASAATTRRLSSLQTVSEYLKFEQSQGNHRPHFTLVGKRAITQETESILFQGDEDNNEYEIDVVLANSAVTNETTYSMYGGPSIPVRNTDVKFLVADPSSSGGSADFALIAIDESTNEVVGIVRKSDEPILKIQEDGEGILTFSEADEYVAKPWSCGAEFADEAEFVGEQEENDPFQRRTKEHDSHDHHHSHQDDHSHTSFLRGGDLPPFDSIVGDLNTLKGSIGNKRKLYATEDFPKLYSYQVDLYIEIDDVFMRNNDNSMEKAVQYVNSIVTAANSIFEKEVDTHLHVAHVALTNLYKNAENTTEILNTMIKTYGRGEWHYKEGKGMDLHHAILGQDWSGGMAYIGTLCNPNMGFAVSTNIAGNYTLNAVAMWDIVVFSHETGHSFGSTHTHDVEGYDPVVDTCGTTCPSELPLSRSTTFMSYCHICNGRLNNLAITFGGSWQEGDRNQVQSWVNNADIAGSVSIEPRRVPKTMWKHVSTRGQCVKPWLQVPNVSCATDADCNDGRPCSVDTCNTINQQCSNVMQPNCCGNDVCEANESECSMDCGPSTLDTPKCNECFLPPGIMFDVIGLQNITIQSMSILMKSGTGNITLFTAPGSYKDKFSDPEKWSIVSELSYNIQGGGYVRVSVASINVDKGTTQALYFTTTGSSMTHKGTGSTVEDDYVKILHDGRAFGRTQFANSESGFSWVGEIVYKKSATSDQPVILPTISPTSSTASPIRSPSSSPIKSPSKSPSVATPPPSTSPTSSSNKSPTASPSAVGTDSPTSGPSTTSTSSPSRSPSLSPTNVVTTPPSTLPPSSPSKSPTASPSAAGTDSPTSGPSTTSTSSPSRSPSLSPTNVVTTPPSTLPPSSPSKLPTASPSAAGTDLPTIPSKYPTMKLSCPSNLSETIVLTNTLTIHYAFVIAVFSNQDNILCAKMVSQSEGWLGFGISPSGEMISAEAVIGLPNDGTVLKYNLNGKSTSAVVPMSQTHQTLRDASITQENGTTVMAFTKYLDEDEHPILVNATNTFIYAEATSNELGYHGSRRSSFNMFVPVTSTTTSPSVSPSFSSSDAPTPSPSTRPTSPMKAPSRSPSVSPSISPFTSPTSLPSKSPASASYSPSESPIRSPSVSPSIPATSPPSSASPSAFLPSKSPSASPNRSPSVSPTALATSSPSKSPASPSKAPSDSPHKHPTQSPSTPLSNSPTTVPRVWYMSYDLMKCRQSCDGPYPCGGKKKFWMQGYATRLMCCEANLYDADEQSMDDCLKL